MGVARRAYLYTVSALSLLVLAIGLYNLVAFVLGEIADALAASIIGGGEGIGREQISLAIALVVVGAPLFAIHWSLVGRGWRGTDDAARDDRYASIRAFHLGLVASVALVFLTIAALELLATAFGAVLGVTQYDERPADPLALVLVAAPIWWYHQRRRNLDIRHDRLTGAAAWITRFHRYAWAFIGLMLLAVGTSQVIETIASVLIGRAGFGGGDADWWLAPLVGSVSLILVGSGLFWFHADDARRAIRDAAIIGEDDRASALRAAYFGGVILVALGYAGVTVASSLAALVRMVIGVGDASDAGGFLELVMGPLLVAIPFAVAGWLHWTAQRREAAHRSPEALVGAERLGLHLAALAGITFLAVGTAQLLGRVLEAVLGSAAADDFLRYEGAWFAALMLVGAGLWLPAWMAVIRRRTADPDTERRAVAGRAYLYLVVGAAVIGLVPSAAFTLYKLFDTILGGGGVALATELAIPIAVIVVAGVVAAYHGRLLASDLRFTRAAEERRTTDGAGAVVAEAATISPGATPPGATPTGALEAPVAAGAAVGAGVPLGAEAPAGAAITLTLRGPAGTDLESVAQSLRANLPAGVVLEER